MARALLAGAFPWDFRERDGVGGVRMVGDCFAATGGMNDNVGTVLTYEHM